MAVFLMLPLYWYRCLAMVFPLVAMVAMVVARFVGLAIAVIFPFVVLALVVLAILPSLFVVFIAVISAFVPIVMVLGLWLIVVILRDRRNCSGASKRHDEC